MKKFAVVIVVALCISINQVSGYVEKCYVCTPPECSDPKETGCSPNPSPDDKFMCEYRKVLDDNGNIITEQSCQEETAEEKVECGAIDKIEGQLCYTCDRDLCNKNSSRIFTSCVFLAILLPIAIYFM